jgi:phenylpropionate dioxygenase-like ring-hydroxylating dioxygenase large terminal subunit
MNAHELALLQRLKRVIDSGENEAALPAPFVSAAAEYVDAALYTRERAALRRRPLPLVPSAAVREPGARVVQDRLGISLVVTRAADGCVHVLKNRCRHRGTALDCSTGQRLVCPYHGWSYGPDGRLLHIPEENGFPGLQNEMVSLIRVPSVEFAGMVWIGGESEAALGECLRPLAEEPELLRLGACRVVDSRRWSGAFNWKLGVNGFLETYHFKVAHKNGIAPHFLWNRLLVDPLGENQRLTLPRSSILKQLATLPAERWEFRTHASFVYFIFPCTFISILPDHASFITFLPDGIEKTHIESHIFVPENATPDDQYWERNAALFRQTITEDMALSESIQTGIEGEATDSFTFATFEQAIAHFRDALVRLVG